MSEDMHDLEARLKAVKITTSKALDDRVRRSWLDDGAEPQQSAAAGRYLLRLPRRFLKTAGIATAAAAVLAAMFFWMTTGTRPPMSAYAELAQAVANTRAAEWVHYVQEFDGNKCEVWYSFQPFRQALKDEEHILYIDGATGKTYYYSRDTKTISADPIPGDEGFAQMMKIKDFFSMEMTSVEMMEKEGSGVTKSRETLRGKACDVYAVSAREGWRVFVEISTQRIVRMEPVANPDVMPSHDFKPVDYDYPTEGPTDIYALGVPKDAKVVEGTLESAKTLQARIEMARNAFAPSYFAIIYRGVVKADGSYAPEEVDVVYKKLGQFRIEKHDTEANDSKRVPPLPDSLPAEDMAALEAWAKAEPLRKVCLSGPRPNDEMGAMWSWQASCVELDRYGRRRRYGETLSWQEHTVEGVTWGYSLPVRVGNPSTKPIAEAGAGSGELTGLEQFLPGATDQGKVVGYPVKNRWFFNVARDYVTERHESFIETEELSKASETRKVVEYGQTPLGQWYAKKVISTIIEPQATAQQPGSEVTIVHLDTTRVIPDDLMNPASLDSIGSDAPVEATFQWQFDKAFKEIDSRADWPATPEELAQVYLGARMAKKFDEMTVMWPGSGAFKYDWSITCRDDKPTEWILDAAKAETGVHKFMTLEPPVSEAYQIVIPYAAKEDFDSTGEYDKAIYLSNERSAKGRYYVVFDQHATRAGVGRKR